MVEKSAAVAAVVAVAVEGSDVVVERLSVAMVVVVVLPEDKLETGLLGKVRGEGLCGRSGGVMEGVVE